MAAGDNEKNFRNVMAANFGASVLAVKKRYKDPNENTDPAKISVDDSILLRRHTRLEIVISTKDPPELGGMK